MALTDSVMFSRPLSDSSLNNRFSEHQDGKPVPGLFSQPSLQHNPSSGQVFTEITCSTRRSIDDEYRKEYPRVNNSGKDGASSLEDMAMREIMRNITALTPDIWADIPWHIGKRIWAEAEKMLVDPVDVSGPRCITDFVLQSRDLVRLSVWKGFVGAYNQDPYTDDNYNPYIRFSEIVPRFPLVERLEHLNSPSAQFITCLTISKVSFCRADIINISLLKNLGALDISFGTFDGSEVDDSVVRNWGRRVTESDDGSFEHLRVLILRNHPGVTARSFPYLNDFPALVLFGIQGCGIGTKDEGVAKSNGWTHQDGLGKLDRLHRKIEAAHHWDSPIRSCYEFAAEVAVDGQEDKEEGNSPAILNFRIGPTSKEVLFNHTRILFFRSNDPRKRQRQSTEISTTVSSIEEAELDVADSGVASTEADKPEEANSSNTTGPKRRRLQKKRRLKGSTQTLVEDIFDEIRKG